MELHIGQVVESSTSLDVKTFIFANQLRGVAALMVLTSHFICVYLLWGPTVSWVTSTPQLQFGTQFLLRLVQWQWLNLGPLGVGIFFLISGFVIPLSLRTHPPGRFLVARIFRIFPTFWVALCLAWALAFAQSHFYGRPMAFALRIYLQNATLTDTIFNQGYVDLVNWTLAIEVKFYLLMALLRPWILRGRIAPLIAVSVIGWGIAIAHSHGLSELSPVLAAEPMYLGFMFIGTLIFYRMANLISLRKSLTAFLILAGLFVASWQAGPLKLLFPSQIINFLYAFVIFGGAYAARSWFRPLAILDFFAAISYPLYLVHPILGFSIMTLLIRLMHFPYAAALPIAFISVVTVAWGLHHLVERPAMALGKRLVVARHSPPVQTVSPLSKPLTQI